MVLWNQIVLVAVLIVFSCPKGLETIPSQHLCGSHLVETLYFVCGQKGFYYVPKANIEHLWPLVINFSGTGSTLRGEESIQENETEQPFPFNKQLNQMMKRGIVDHCCHNTCSLYDLEGYCNQ
ncbi:insulin-like [Heterodontus francisci]|uniref:insulin-like n=1 Tax=Heterodontus francisci TaxID=7792 RepID=UPI00355B503D